MKKKLKDDYWDKKATVLEYHSKLINSEGTNNAFTCPDTLNNEEIYNLAVEKVGIINFDEEVKSLGIEDFYKQLSLFDINNGVAIGVFGAIAAFFVDYKGEKIEPKFFSNIDKNHPADYRKGNKHRYYFGHDILNPWQKLPEGFKYPQTANGKTTLVNVGNKTLFDLVADSKCPNFPFFKKVLCVNTLNMIHYVRDMLTTSGLPLPGSSFFTKWDEADNTSGYSSSNIIMDTLGAEYGSLKASDFLSVALMKTLISFYTKATLSKYNLDPNAEKIYQKQISTLAYGSCLIIQMNLLLAQMDKKQKLKKRWHGAKLNLVLLTLFAKNTIQLSYFINKEHKQVISNYDRNIAMLKKELESLESWET